MKKSLKKALSLVLTMVMVFSLFGITAFAAEYTYETYNATFTVGNVTVARDSEEFVVPLTITNNGDKTIEKFSISIAYPEQDGALYGLKRFILTSAIGENGFEFPFVKYSTSAHPTSRSKVWKESIHNIAFAENGELNLAPGESFVINLTYKLELFLALYGEDSPNGVYPITIYFDGVDQGGPRFWLANDNDPKIASAVTEGSITIVDGAPIVAETGKLGVVRSEASSTLKGVFDLVANITEKKANLIEATISYNPALYDVESVSAVNGATVEIVKNDAEAGKVTVVIGVANEAALGNTAAQTLATLSVTPKSGQTPEMAYVEVTAFAAYAAGEVLDITADPQNASSPYTYRDALDVNGDGEITAADLSLVLFHFGTLAEELPEGVFADVDGDGSVTMIDITLLVNALYA